MTPELAALLRACKYEPEDDAPRLVLADWLEEHGDEERARYIRKQVGEGANSIDCRPPNSDWLGAWWEWAWASGGAPKGPGDNEAVFSRGLLRLHSQEGFPGDFGRLLDPPFEWDWVESVSGSCWTSTADWTPLLKSAKVHEVSSLGIGGGGRIEGLAEQFAASQPLPNLSDLFLHAVDLTDHRLATLCRTPMPRLRALALGNNRITAKGVREIAGHPQFNQLRRLELSSNPIGNSGAKLLVDGRSRSTLRHLDLTSCDIEDSGMLRLASEDHLPNLERLFLYGNRITDRGVKALLGLRRRRPLNVHLGGNPGISTACQAKLQQTFGQGGWLKIGGTEVPE